MSEQRPSKFENAAASQSDVSLARELWEFLKYNRKWWMLPVMVALLLLGVLVFLSGTAAAPFIYTLF
ncbi:MAG TPA: hypothetical protein DEH78_03415 [Solibacterales bacterium]|nr:hypothetical protein [Bryobacterales bacterium]